MLFSNEAVAEQINTNFESAWESVHPVPVVTIDFGDGHLIERTIGGNVATYVCTSEGQVLDILPGVYLPDVYTDRLRQFALLYQWVRSERGAEGVARDYHLGQVGSLAGRGSRSNIVARQMPSRSIVATEGRLRFSLAQPGEAREALVEELRRRGRLGRRALVPEIPDIDSAEALQEWPVLAEETERNETVHRKLIHQHLAETGLVPPDEITNWLFRDVLGADLEDPYLGMGDLLLEAQAGSDNRGSSDALIDSEPAATDGDQTAPPSDR